MTESTSACIPNKTIYKDVFNKHRRKPDDPLYIGDLHEMVDFSSSDPALHYENVIDLSKRQRYRHHHQSSTCNGCSVDYVNSSGVECEFEYEYEYHGPIYGLKSHPGFAYMPSALSTPLQHDLVYKAVTEFCEPPHGTNIDLVPCKKGVEELNSKEGESMWELWKRENVHVCDPVKDNGEGEGEGEGGDTNSYSYPNASDESTQSKKKKKIKMNKNGSDHGGKGTKNGTSNSNNAKGNSKKKKKRYYKSFEKLSWATLGYRFDWTARAYREKNKSAMPEILDQLGKFFAKLGEETRCNIVDDDYSCRTPEIDSDSASSGSGSASNGTYSFTASAAIVNYYSLKSSMGGHRDDSELDITKPVVSFSLGLPAVFLIGGKTRDEGPVVPILLRPGDVMLLGGDSRLNFHGVARILSHGTTLPPVGGFMCNSEEIRIGGKNVDDFQIRSWSCICGHQSSDDGVVSEMPHSDRLAIEQFLMQHRVNANVRQVLPDGVERIPEDES